MSFYPSYHDPSMAGATGFILGSEKTSNTTCSKCLIAISWMKTHTMGEWAIPCCQVKWELYPPGQRILGSGYFQGMRKKAFQKTFQPCVQSLFFFFYQWNCVCYGLCHTSCLVWDTWLHLSNKVYYLRVHIAYCLHYYQLLIKQT